MNIFDIAEGKRLDVRQVMDFSSDVNPLGPSNKAKNAIRKGVKYLSFPPDSSIRQLKRYICRREQIGEEHIMFGEGLPRILHLLIQAIKPKTITMLAPVSNAYEEIVSRYDTQPITHPLKEENCFSVEMDELIDNMERAGMVMLSNPHGVTGTILPVETLARLIEKADKKGAILVIDETYREFTQAASPVQEVIGSGSAVILRNFSVFHALSGLPFGYAIGPIGLINMINSVAVPQQINTLALTAAYASLKDKGYRDRTLKFIKEEKGFITDRLKHITGLTFFDTPCNFLLLKVKESEVGLKDSMLKAAILTATYRSEDGHTYVKLPIKTHKYNARFIKALRRILEAG